MTRSADLLANKPARPSTPVPGHWLLDLPSASSQIYIRRFRPQLQPQAGFRQNGGSILKKLRNDPLESGWIAITSSGGGEPAALLDGWCCTVATGGKGEDEAPLLWCFDGRDEEEDPSVMLNGLQGVSGLFSLRNSAHDPPEVLPSLPPISVADLLSCPQHGRNLACLKPRTGKACNVIFNPEVENAYRWEILRDAVVEKLAWKSGRRVAMKSGLSELR